MVGIEVAQFLLEVAVEEAAFPDRSSYQRLPGVSALQITSQPSSSLIGEQYRQVVVGGVKTR